MLSNCELEKINGGAISKGLSLLIGAAISFIIGFIEGLTRNPCTVK